jgi:hypothetical protein
VRLSTFAVIPAVGMALFLAACGSDSSTTPKTSGLDPARCTVGTIAAGQSAQGDLNPANGNTCAEGYPFEEGDSDNYVAYKFGVTSGTGYLVSLAASWDNHVELMQASPIGEQLIGVSDECCSAQSTIPFVANATTTYGVRVGQDDPLINGAPSDTGAYTLRVQTCKVPVTTVTDSITHVDSLTTSDCVNPRGDFSEDSSYIHIYTIHFAAPGDQRTIAITAGIDQPLIVRAGGPGYDPYCYFTDCLLYDYGFEDNSWTVTAPDSGTYTMVLGTESFTSSTVPYTVTFGSDVSAASHVTPPPTARSAAARLMAKGKKHMTRLSH